MFTMFLKACIHRLRAAGVTADVLREPERQLPMFCGAGILGISIYIMFIALNSSIYIVFIALFEWERQLLRFLSL